VFLHNCINVIWPLERMKKCFFFSFDYFFHKKISITLQRMQTFFILRQTIVVGLATFWFLNTPPISTADLSIASNRFFTWRNTINLHKQSIFHMQKYDLPIASNRFFTCRNMIYLLQAIDFSHGEIWSTYHSWPTYCKQSIFHMEKYDQLS
jgi:hypothetical protein